MQINAHGNSATTTKLQTARNIKLQGAVSGNANFDGSGNITINTTQSNIAVITGNMDLDANSSSMAAEGYCTFTQVDNINYPNGFSKDNCVVISYARKGVKGFGYGWNNYPNSADLFTGSLPITIRLDDKISISAGNLSVNAQTITYKIVLMKIS